MRRKTVFRLLFFRGLVEKRLRRAGCKYSIVIVVVVIVAKTAPWLNGSENKIKTAALEFVENINMSLSLSLCMRIYYIYMHACIHNVQERNTKVPTQKQLMCCSLYNMYFFYIYIIYKYYTWLKYAPYRRHCNVLLLVLYVANGRFVVVRRWWDQKER